MLENLRYSMDLDNARSPDFENWFTTWVFINERPVAQLAERRSPKPQVGGSMPSWPANRF